MTTDPHISGSFAASSSAESNPLCDFDRIVFSRPEVVDYYVRLQTLFECEKRVFARYIRDGMRVLDLGVGGGRTTPHLSASAARYVAVDNSETMVAAFRARFPNVECIQADATDLAPLASDSLDLVLFAFNGIDYIYPLDSREKCLAEVRRVLCRGGTFIFSSHYSRCMIVTATPAKGLRRLFRYARVGLLSAIQIVSSLRLPSFWRGTGYSWMSDHGRLLTYSTTPAHQARELQKAGFELIDTTPSCFTWPSLTAAWYYYVARKG